MKLAHRQRGQATVETAVFLPLFLLVLFGVFWAVQSSVMSERTQIAVRFSGLISDEASPYAQYSLGSLYDALPNLDAPQLYSCVQPVPEALDNDPASGYFPGPQSPSFFQPVSGTTVSTCNQGETSLSGGSMTSPLLFVHTKSGITTSVAVPSFLQNLLGPLQDLTASQNFFDGPDIRTMLTCYPDLGSAVSQSLTHAALDVSVAATPLPDIPNTSPIALSSSC